MAKKKKKSVFGLKAVLNKYTISFVFFIVWIGFMDQHNLVTQYKLSSALHEMQDKQDHYEKQIKETRMKREQIENNREKFAREKYYMKKANEEVFIIEPQKK